MRYSTVQHSTTQYTVRNIRCTVTIDSVLVNSKTQNAFLFTVHAMIRYDCLLAVKPASTPWRLVHKTRRRDSLPTDMLRSAVTVLVVAQPIAEFPEGLTNYPVRHDLLINKTESNKIINPLAHAVSPSNSSW